MVRRTPVERRPWRIVVVSVGSQAEKERALERVMDHLARSFNGHFQLSLPSSESGVARESSYLYSSLQ